MDKRLIDSLGWLARWISDERFNECTDSDGTVAKDGSSKDCGNSRARGFLSFSLHPVLSASRSTAFYRERKLSARLEGYTQKYAGLQSITARGKYGRSKPWDCFPWRLYVTTGEPNHSVTHYLHYANRRTECMMVK